MQLNETELVTLKICTLSKKILDQMQIITFSDFNLKSVQEWIQESVILGWCNFKGHPYIIRKHFDAYKLDPVTYPIPEGTRQIFII